MLHREPEEYHPQYDEFLADEIRRSRRRFLLGINREPYYYYEWNGVNAEAKTNAIARIRALEAPKEREAEQRQRPVIQRPVYQVNRPANIVYKTEVKPMFKFTVGMFFGFIGLAILIVIGAFFLMNNITQGVQDAHDAIIVQPGPATAEPVWSNEVIPHPAQPERPELGSGSSKEASDTIHHEGIELLKERSEGEGRNR